jgi:TIR domain
MQNDSKPRVFISHSSQDKAFVSSLASALYMLGNNVWYDDWEIAVGDSIVDKVFNGLASSDTLIIVLSQISVNSRWVKEELNTAVMRRISENNVRILPILIEDCEIPTPLKHIKYADFRENYDEGFYQLVESLAPGHLVWQSLSHLYDHFGILSDQILDSEFDSDESEKILKLHSLLESALNLRTEIELRRAHQKVQDLNFFEKIGLLVEKGIDVRSQTWNTLVNFRAGLTHNMQMHTSHLRSFAFMLQERYGTEDLRESLVKGLERLNQIMRMICFDEWDIEKLRRI